ncbi:S1C family serine protease [Methylocella sp. CPCC 101449]|jgi:S1-C subfamily serine protease|uniref:S1C family serine protease n=1 Tax=Methylocella sp. CPCC 101449 TaxID=2987531 RepID=UPI00288D4F4D|nr:S1C family serine protease [Methylocella sp. CPCC 101449]MDT2021980.1 S1C family serine protease [Methylocella sp. CPCC 101449]HEV2572088.1 S1C family serine protease [Beijerinckiaceae bacterium]
MPSQPEWRLPSSLQPKAHDYVFDLDDALLSVVSLSARVPEEAFTAETLGTERAGNAVLINDRGLFLTIGYLITEAEEVWLRSNDGRTFAGTVIGYDQESGFGLVQALARLDLPHLPLGSSASARAGDAVIVAGAGGREHSVAGRIVAKQEFAGYWEYVLDEAIYTAPAHPNWGGTALINETGELLGIGSLHLEQGGDKGERGHLNMIVPIDLLKPILDDLVRLGRRSVPPRPWLGIYAAEIEDKVVVVGRSQRGPARRAELKNGDIVVAIGGKPISSLAQLYRTIYAQGDAGCDIPMTLHRDGVTFDVSVRSGDRTQMFKAPKLH